MFGKSWPSSMSFCVGYRLSGSTGGEGGGVLGGDGCTANTACFASRTTPSSTASMMGVRPVLNTHTHIPHTHTHTYIHTRTCCSPYTHMHTHAHTHAHTPPHRHGIRLNRRGGLFHTRIIPVCLKHRQLTADSTTDYHTCQHTNCSASKCS